MLGTDSLYLAPLHRSVWQVLEKINDLTKVTELGRSWLNGFKAKVNLSSLHCTTKPQETFFQRLSTHDSKRGTLLHASEPFCHVSHRVGRSPGRWEKSRCFSPARTELQENCSLSLT